MRSLLDYAGFAQLCGRSPIMRKIMCTHNRIIPRSLGLTDLVLVKIFHMSLFLLICKFSPHPPNCSANLTDGKTWICRLHLLPYLQQQQRLHY